MAVKTVRVKVGERWYTVQVTDLSTSPIQVTVEGETFYVEVEGLPTSRRAPTGPTGPRPPRAASPQARSPAPIASEKVIRAPMPGKVMSVTVRPGDNVSHGQEVCVLEAMKMEQSIRVPRAGIIKTVHVQPLQQVSLDDPLIELE